MTRPHRNFAAPFSAEYRAAMGAATILVAVYLIGLVTSVRSGSAVTYDQELRLRLDPNSASQPELMLLPGIGPKLARRIVEYRDGCPERPAFRVLEDLRRVRGIGPAVLSRLRDHLTFPVEPAPNTLDHGAACVSVPRSDE